MCILYSVIACRWNDDVISRAALETIIVARYMLMREIIEQITAGSPMAGTPIILVQRPIVQSGDGRVKDL